MTDNCIVIVFHSPLLVRGERVCKKGKKLSHMQLKRVVQSNLVNMNSTGPSKKVHIKRNFTLTVARCMCVIIPGDFKVVHIKRFFALNVFVLTRFHCSSAMNLNAAAQ